MVFGMDVFLVEKKKKKKGREREEKRKVKMKGKETFFRLFSNFFVLVCSPVASIAG